MHSCARHCPHASSLAIRPWGVQLQLGRLHACTSMRLHASQVSMLSVCEAHAQVHVLLTGSAWRATATPADWLHATYAHVWAMQGRARPPPSELIFQPADTAPDQEPLVQIPQSHPAHDAASRKQQGGSGSEAGIRWPSPGESSPFWERPARTAPAPLQSGDPARLLIAQLMQAA